MKLRPVFNKFDADSSGAISTSEMGAVCKAIKVELTPEQMQRMMVDADLDKSGEIEFEEFISVLNLHLAPRCGPLQTWSTACGQRPRRHTLASGDPAGRVVGAGRAAGYGVKEPTSGGRGGLPDRSETNLLKLPPQWAKWRPAGVKSNWAKVMESGQAPH